MIYQFYEPTARGINGICGWIYESEGVGFLALYGGPVSILWNGWRTIVRQRNRLESFNEQLEIQVEDRTRQLTLAHQQLVEYADQAKELAVVGRVDGLGRVVDTNGDGVVNINVISAIASNFGLTSPLPCQ